MTLPFSDEDVDLVAVTNAIHDIDCESGRNCPELTVYGRYGRYARAAIDALARAGRLNRCATGCQAMAAASGAVNVDFDEEPES